MERLAPGSRTKAILLIFSICLIIYSNSLGGEFIYDDEYFIVRNINIRNLENLPSFFTYRGAVAFSGLSNDVYRPITTISYALDYFIWKFNAFGYHLSNVLFHSSSAILLFIFLCALFDNVLTALFASLFFACHPVQTEVVSWISGRSSVLALFFYLSALISYAQFMKRTKRSFYISSLIFYAAALFSKEMSVTLPLILIAYDIHFSNSEALRKKIFRYLPYFLLTLFYIFARASVLGRVSQCGWWGDSPYYTFLTMSKSLVQYIKLLFLPVKLCAFYVVHIARSIAETKVMISLLLLTILFGMLPPIFRRYRIASFSIWWFFITLLPVSNIVPLKALVAERFLYIPSIGFCMLMAAFLRNGKRAASLLGAILIITYSFRTMARNEDWKDAVTMSKAILKVSPLNPWGFNSLGAAYLGKGMTEEAEKPLKKAIVLVKDYAAPKSTLGFCYLKMDRYEDAIELFKESLVLRQDNLEALNSLGIAYARLRRYDEAIRQFETSIRLDPTFMSAYLNLGATYEALNKYDKAIKIYEEAGSRTKSGEDIAISHIRIGDVYFKTGQKEKARRYYEDAVGLCGRGMEELKKIAEERLFSGGGGRS